MNFTAEHFTLKFSSSDGAREAAPGWQGSQEQQRQPAVIVPQLVLLLLESSSELSFTILELVACSG